MFHRIFVGIVACLALTGCFYESTVDLRSQTTAYDLARFIDVGEHFYVDEDGERLLTLTVTADGASVTRQTNGSSPDYVSFKTGLGSPDFPEKTFVAMTDGSMREGVRHYKYYGFQYGAQHLAWIRPSEISKVKSAAELGRGLQSDITSGRSTLFRRVPDKDIETVRAHFARLRASELARAKEKADAKKAETQAPPAAVTAPSARTVKGLTIGDGVYVQGWLKDEAAMIQAFDESGRRVKVLRYSDGISEWVATDSIISRGQAAANNVGRVGVAVGIMACLAKPELCRGQ